MNTQFRDRLTGAVILVILIVAIVPALLSGPPAPPAATGTVDGPPLRSYTIDLTEPVNGERAASPSISATPAPVTAAPATSAPVTAAPTAASVGAGFALQIGSFGNADNANRLVAKLRKRDFAAFVSPTGSAPRLYRVRVGPVADLNAAEALATRLAAAGQPGKIVTHP